MKLSEFIERLKDVAAACRESAELYVIENKDNILDTNKMTLLKSRDADGRPIYPNYSYQTMQINKNKTFTYKEFAKKKIKGEPFFFYDTGAFFDSFNLRLDGKGFVMSGDTFKKNEGGEVFDLRDYGHKLIGLPPIALDNLGKSIAIHIIKYLKDKHFKGEFAWI